MPGSHDDHGEHRHGHAGAAGHARHGHAQPARSLGGPNRATVSDTSSILDNDRGH